jgi:hypothetical protein
LTIDKQVVVKKRWRAYYNEEYYFIEYVEVKTFVEKYDELDDKLYEMGNYFRTREQAESVAKEVKGFLKNIRMTDEYRADRRRRS